MLVLTVQDRGVRSGWWLSHIAIVDRLHAVELGIVRAAKRVEEIRSNASHFGVISN